MSTLRRCAPQIFNERALFVESHSQIGSDCMYDLVRLVTGFDFVDLVTRMVWTNRFRHRRPPNYKGVAGMQYRRFLKNGLPVGRLTNREYALEVPGVAEIKDLRKRGTVTRPLRDGLDRSYYMLAHGEEGNAVDLAVRQADRHAKYPLQGTSL